MYAEFGMLPPPDNDLPPLFLRLFGPFDARVAGAPLPRLRSRKGLHLLALLALRAGREVGRDWVADILWPDSPPDAALVSLRQTLVDLRRALGEEAPRLASPTPRTLRLDLEEGAVCDVSAFDASLQRGSAESLVEAVALYTGPLLEDWAEEWVLEERGAFETRYQDALRTLAAQARGNGDASGAARYLARLVATDPLQEEGVQDLMRAQADAGDLPGAIRAYDDLCAALRERLGQNAKPLPRTEALRRLLSEGEVRRPAAGLAGGASPRSLPQPLTTLVGREADAAAVEGRLSAARLVTLTGTGGVGKTRLAVRVADVAADGYSDGAWFVDLSPLAAQSGEEAVLRAVTASLSIPEDSDRSPVESLIAYLRSRSLLLVLDNCEHVLAEAAALTERILLSCSGVRVLATSRQPLGLAGEAVWRVPSLPSPAAVRLFVARATEARADFALTDANAEAVARLCAHLDGIPLALELAAPAVRSLSVEAIVHRLTDHLPPLAGAGGTAASRQRTLRAALDWSWDLLTESERALLAQLSVFVGGWTREEAEAVCGEEADSLLPLVERSLAVFEEREGYSRYRLLETVRQYAANRLEEAGATERVRAGHAECFVALAEVADAALQGAEQAATLDRLTREQDNFRAALRWALSAAGGSEGLAIALRLSVALWTFWKMRDHVREGAEWLEAVIARYAAPGAPPPDPVLYRKALQGAGSFAGLLGDMVTARCRQEESLTLARSQGSRIAEAAALNNLGNTLGTAGDPAGACRLLAECLTLLEEVGNDWQRAVTQANLGLMFLFAGETTEAETHLRPALTELHRLGDLYNAARAQEGLAEIARIAGDLVGARTHLEGSLALRRQLNARREVALSLNNLGIITAMLGEYDAAEAMIREAMATRLELQDRWGIALALEAFAELARERGGEPEREVRLWAAAAALRDAVRLPPTVRERATRDADLAAARAALGTEAFDRLYAGGSAMGWERAVTYALGEAGASL